MGVKVDEAIRSREGWQIGDAAFRKKFFDDLSLMITEPKSVRNETIDQC